MGEAILVVSVFPPFFLPNKRFVGCRQYLYQGHNDGNRQFWCSHKIEEPDDLIIEIHTDEGKLHPIVLIHLHQRDLPQRFIVDRYYIFCFYLKKHIFDVLIVFEFDGFEESGEVICIVESFCFGGDEKIVHNGVLDLSRLDLQVQECLVVESCQLYEVLQELVIREVLR